MMTKDQFVHLYVSPEIAQKHIDLVKAGLQTKVRAIMAIYGTTREIAEQIELEINQEETDDSSDSDDFFDEVVRMND